jgi:ATP-dependent protease ClpP protease subunit
MRPCFVFNSAPAEKPGSLSIMDEIGFWGTQAKDFQASLSAITAKEIVVEINSPGGDYFAGLSMYNMLRSSGKTVTTKVMGVAASAATVVFAAGDVRQMPKNTMLMVHNPANYGGGTAEDHREMADILDKIAAGARTVYTSNSKLTDDEVAEMLSKDTWLTADEAVEMGLATVVTPEIKATASFDMTRADLPESVRAIYAQAQQDGDPGPEVIPDSPVATAIHDLAIKSNLKDFAAHMAITCDTLDMAQTRIKTASEIVALCQYAKKPEAAGPAIRANKTLAEVRAEIVAAFAQEDVHTSTVKKLDPATMQATTKPKSTAAIWASHQSQSKK